MIRTTFALLSLFLLVSLAGAEEFKVRPGFTIAPDVLGKFEETKCGSGGGSARSGQATMAWSVTHEVVPASQVMMGAQRVPMQAGACADGSCGSSMMSHGSSMMGYGGGSMMMVSSSSGKGGGPVRNLFKRIFRR